MINVELLPKAYKEISEILKYIPEEKFRKIPTHIIKYFEENQDKNYYYKIVHFDDFENQKMLKETEAILTVIFRDYLTTPEQMKSFREKENHDIQLFEKQKREKYNPDDIFKKDIKKNKTSNNLPVIVEHQNIINKIMGKIKKFFK